MHSLADAVALGRPRHLPVKGGAAPLDRAPNVGEGVGGEGHMVHFVHPRNWQRLDAAADVAAAGGVRRPQRWRLQ